MNELLSPSPGPWFWRNEEDDCPQQWVIESAEGRWIAEFPRLVDECHAQQRVDARLISAARELLDAMQAILALDDGDKPDLWHFEDEFKAGRAAVAKALGDQS